MFTTPCFIRKNNLELISNLKNLGYKCNPYLGFNIIASNHFYKGNIYSYENDKYLIKNKYIDCGENEQLFLAIAALNDDNDYMQWFITEVDQSWVNQGVYCPRGSFILCTIEHYCLDKFSSSVVPAHKATVKELVEHFKN